MRLARIAGLVIGVWFALANLHPAEACGFWRMADKERKLDVGWLINAGSVTTTKGNKRLAALYLDLEAKDGLRVVTSKQVIFDIKGDKVRRYGKVIGRIDSSGGVVFGKQTFTIELSDKTAEHEMPTWKMVVKRGDTVVIESEHASALCAGFKKTMTDEEAQEEVRRRVIFYLAWRELGF